MPLTRDEKERKVKELYDRGVNIRDISKRVHMSFGDIGQITRKHSGDEYSIKRSKKYSKLSQALELFQKGASNLEVAIKVGLTDSETIEAQKQYKRLIHADKFCELYDQMEGNLEHYLFLNQELKNVNVGVQDAIEGLAYARRLDEMKIEYNRLQNDLQLKNQVIYHSLQEEKALKNQIYSLRSQVQVLNESKTRIWNKIEGKQPNQEGRSTKRRRRRVTPKESYDIVSGDSPLIDTYSPGSSEKGDDLMS